MLVYKGEKFQDIEVEMFLGIVFICNMEYRVCVCAASLVEKERCKDTKWRYDRVEKAAHIAGRAKDCVHCSLTKVLFAIGGNKLWCHREFCVSGGFGERPCMSPLMLPRGEMRAR